MAVIPNGFAEVSLRWTIPGPGSPAFNVFGVQNVASMTALQIATEVAGILADEANALFSYIDDSYSTDLIRVVENSGGIETFAELPFVEEGGDVGSGTPPQVSYLIKKISGLTGRQNRGRMFLPGVPEAAVDESGSIASGFRTGIDAAFGALRDELIALDLPPVILHTSISDPPTLVAAFVTDGLVATQRRRLR